MEFIGFLAIAGALGLGVLLVVQWRAQTLETLGTFYVLNIFIDLFTAGTILNGGAPYDDGAQIIMIGPVIVGAALMAASLVVKSNVMPWKRYITFLVASCHAGLHVAVFSALSYAISPEINGIMPTVTTVSLVVMTVALGLLMLIGIVRLRHTAPKCGSIF